MDDQNSTLTEFSSLAKIASVWRLQTGPGDPKLNVEFLNFTIVCQRVSWQSSTFKSRYCANWVAQNKIYLSEITSRDFVAPAKMKLLQTGRVHKVSCAQYEQQMYEELCSLHASTAGEVTSRNGY